jgi:amino acid adenylation domain-containing protein
MDSANPVAEKDEFMQSIHSSLEQLDIRDIEKLRSLAKARGVKKRDRDSSPITKIPRDAGLPLSFSQQGLWFLAQSEEVSATYHIFTALRLRGNLDRSALRRSLDTIFLRHEALRSTFIVVNSQPLVEILPSEMGLPLIEHDLRGAADVSERLNQLKMEEAKVLFDLAKGPMIRGRLIRLDQQEDVLLLTWHHIVSDGWSMGIFARELGELYRAFSQGQPNPLAQLTIQYPDYAAWQREWLTGERAQKLAEFWRQTLTDTPLLLELPTDRPRPPQQSFVSGYIPICIGSELALGLRNLSNRHRSTVFMTVLAAWAAVLSRLSGQQDLVIGTPSANRGRPETEGLIGVFLNSLALRINVAGQPSVTELLKRVCETTIAAQDHQDLPFEQVVEIVQPPRSLNHTPLFQVMLVWESGEQKLPELPGVSVTPAWADSEMVKFDLRLGLSETNGSIRGGMNYSTALFDEASIQRQIGYLITMLNAMVADSSQAVAGIDLVPPEERTQLLDTWNATDAHYADHVCVQQLFEEQARRTPEARAVVCEDKFISYEDLNVEANRLAHHLIVLGVKPDDRVAICVERSVAMVIGVLAIVKAGGAYVPIDPAYPSERLAQILADADPGIVLSDAVGREVLGREALEGLIVLDLDTLKQPQESRPVWADMPSTNPDPKTLGLTPDHLAYVIYTSGSTGKPKGVMGMHRPVINLIEWLSRKFQIGPSDVVLLTSSLSFDLSVYDIFGLLAVGGCIRVASREELADPQKLARILFERDVTFWDSAPAVFQQLIFCLGDAAHGQETPLLRLAFFSGDWIPLEFFGVIRRSFPKCQMISLGGATEATVWSNFYPVQCVEPWWVSIPYGRPIQNARYYVLDEYLNHTPWGAQGHLYIGGQCLTDGYLNRPELTAERFLPDPFHSIPGARMYKTGDLARHLPDSNLQFLGRNDHQVKIRGFRIELGEIEAKLAEHPLVREAVVVAREDIPGDKRLVAYVYPAAPEDGRADSSRESAQSPAGLAAVLRMHLASRLPEYMIPKAFVKLDAVPMTPNGKLDRKALPAPDWDAYARRTYEEPQGEVEKILASLWQEILGIERIGRHDHFFELGGHSVMVVKFVDRLRRLNLQIDIRSIFAMPILSEIASKTRQLEEIRL